jgi:hypothetical protein
LHLCLNPFIVPIPAEEDSKIDRHDLEADNISINGLPKPKYHPGQIGQSDCNFFLKLKTCTTN